MSMTPELYSISALAVELGMDRRTVAAKLKDLQPAEVKGRVKKYKMVDALAAIRGGGAEGALDLSQETARLRRAQAEKTEIEVARLRGELLAGKEVARATAGYIIACRSRLLSMPPRLAQRAASLFGCDPREAEELLADGVHEALGELQRMESHDYGLADSDGSADESEQALGTASAADRKRVGRPKSSAGRRKQ